MIKTILLGLILSMGITYAQTTPFDAFLTFPDSTGTSDSIRVSSQVVPVGLYAVDSLDNDSANVSFQLLIGLNPSRQWLTLETTTAGPYVVNIADSTYVALDPDVFGQIEGTSGSETPLWIRAVTDSLQDGDRSLGIRFGNK